jgi:hypothetical protein
MDDAGIPALLDAIRHLHGVEAKHLETIHVDERHEGERVWEGDVEVFALTGHPLATKAYAWSEATTGTKRRFFAVLHVAPIDSAAKAVQGSILADAKAVEEAKGRLS